MIPGPLGLGSAQMHRLSFAHTVVVGFADDKWNWMESPGRAERRSLYPANGTSLRILCEDGVLVQGDGRREKDRVQ
jgi:hypothetical protein